MLYAVSIEAIVLQSIEVEANSLKEAMKKAEDEFASEHDSVSVTAIHACEAFSPIKGKDNAN